MFRMGLILVSLLAASILMPASVRTTRFEILIYGGGPQAVAAALTASGTAGNRADILMIVPEREPGSIMTAGKQNLFDLNYYRPSKLPPGLPQGYEGSQGGSLFRFVRDLGAAFPPDAMVRYFDGLLKSAGRIRVLYETELTHVELRGNSGSDSQAIEAVRFRKLKKNAEGRYRYEGPESAPVRADIFVDASETGRLLRMSGADFHTGREDTGTDRLQMAATLMYKVKGVSAYQAVEPDKSSYGVAYSAKGSFQFWAGREAYTIPEILEFDRNSPHFRLKAYNAGEDGYFHVGSDTSDTPFWMNHLIIYHVDARKAWRDHEAGNGLYPPEQDGLDPEAARDMAIAELKKPEFWEMLRKLPGWEGVQPVLRGGEPEVGDILYLRESIHARNKPGEEKPHALVKEDVMNGGEKLYRRRIGLGFYHFDSNTYRKQEKLTNPLHEPWYVPYEVLRTPYIDNLLLPGYAANIDSYSWSAMRVYPNLIMLGDAAGAAAGLAVQRKFDIARPDEAEMKLLQDTLFNHQAILEK